jgi:iron complex outermembrane recepter protein
VSVTNWSIGIALTGFILTIVASSAALAQDDDDLSSVTVSATRATTATKTDTALIEIPQSISVITGDQFLDRGVLTMQETLRYSAGVVSEAYGLDTRSDQPMVRGFYSIQFLDGMTKLFGYSLIPRAEVYTLERVEVLRGPSSVLYGKGNAGGVMNLVSKRPRFETQGELGFQLGSYDRKQLQLDVTGAIAGSETWAGRIVAVGRDSEMQTDEISDDRIVLAPSVAWRAGERTTVTFLGLYQDDETASSQQFLPVAATLLAPPGRRLRDETFLGEPDFDKLDTRQTMGSVLVEHAFSDSLRLNSSVRYVDADTSFNEIYPDVYSDPSNPFLDDERRIVARSSYSIVSNTEYFTNDNSLQYDFAYGRFTHKLLGGVDFLGFRESSRSGSDSVDPIDIYAPVYGNFTAPELGPTATQRQRQIGFYLQDQIRYADRVSVVLGARRDRATSEVTDADKEVDYATTYRAGVIVDVGAGFSPYVSYSESFLPIPGMDLYQNRFRPQEGRQYEAGIKWQPRPGTLVTLAGFDIDETNRQTNDPEEVLNTIQTGRVESKGVEIEVLHEVADNLNVTASYSRTEAEVTRSTFTQEVGVQLSDVPKDLASVWGVKTFAFGSGGALRVGAGVRYVGETLSTAFSGSLTTPSYTLADALVAFEAPTWSATLNATNVFDKSYYAPCRAFGDCFTGNRRSIIGTLRYRF